MIEIHIDGYDPVKLNPGDSFDLGEEGLIIFHNTEDAKAIRILQAEHQRKVREVIAFVKNKYGIKE